MNIFGHTDVDGDRVEVGDASEEWDSIHDGSLAITVTGGNRMISCALPRDRVERLYDALGFWLFPGVTAAEDPEPIYAALIRRLVAEEVARVRESVVPLHSSPQAYVPECDATLCTLPGCGLIPDRPTHLEHDPEPRDVGIVDSAPRFPAVHMVTEAECTEEHCIAPRHLPASTRPRLMTELPRRTPSTVIKGVLELRCSGCGHHKADHGTAHCWGNETGPECTCMGFGYGPGTRRGAPGCSECEHADQSHAVLNGGCSECACTRSRDVR